LARRNGNKVSEEHRLTLLLFEERKRLEINTSTTIRTFLPASFIQSTQAHFTGNPYQPG
jgi:hypothetical protein